MSRPKNIGRIAWDRARKRRQEIHAECEKHHAAIAALDEEDARLKSFLDLCDAMAEDTPASPAAGDEAGKGPRPPEPLPAEEHAAGDENREGQAPPVATREDARPRQHGGPEDFGGSDYDPLPEKTLILPETGATSAEESASPGAAPNGVSSLLNSPGSASAGPGASSEGEADPAYPGRAPHP